MTNHLTWAKLPGLAAGLLVGLLLSVAIEPAEAAKAGNIKSNATTSIKPPPGPNVRDHRGEKTKLRRPPSCRGGGGPLCNPYKTNSIVRDHRTPQSPREKYGWGGSPR